MKSEAHAVQVDPAHPAHPAGVARVRHASLLQRMQELAVARAMDQFDSFRDSLLHGLLTLSETSKRPAEEQASFNAYNQLRNRGQEFHLALQGALERLTSAACRELEKGRALALPLPDSNDFEAMEDRVLLDEATAAIEHPLAEPLGMLDLRIASLMGRDASESEVNPWRPQIFVFALYQAWSHIDHERASRRVMLGLLSARLFLRLDAIYAALNAMLADEPMLPDPKPALQKKRKAEQSGVFAATSSPVIQARGERYNRVRDWLLASPASAKPSDDGEHLNLPDLFAPPDENGNWQANTISLAVGPRLFSHLTRLQQQLEDSSVGRAIPASGEVLRQIRKGLPAGLLTPVDENTIELLARIFDYLLDSADIAPTVKGLLARLQIPMLKAALLDRKFFIDGKHPAHGLLDRVVGCSVGWDASRGEQDPLFQLLESVVEQANAGTEHDSKVFSLLLGRIDAFLLDEERQAETMLAPAVTQALRAERVHRAQQAAEADLDKRLDTGAVPQFLEAFLGTQWLRILVLAHSVRDKKPEMLVRALAAMDDLIWSLQPKSLAERKNLLSRLPGILAEVNLWLDAIKWQAPERTTFFSLLAERHAALVRTEKDSEKARIEAALAMARRASERKARLGGSGKGRERLLQAMSPASGLCHGDWLELQDTSGARQRMRLAWISPARSQFIFSDRQASRTVLRSGQDLDRALQQGEARPVMLDHAVERALDAALAPREAA